MGDAPSIHKPLPIFVVKGNDFITITTDIQVDIKHLLQMINRAGTRHGTDVKEDVNIGLKNGSEHLRNQC